MKDLSSSELIGNQNFSFKRERRIMGSSGRGFGLAVDPVLFDIVVISQVESKEMETLVVPLKI